jgi:acetolactate synthase-1/2/3 large subunit
VIVAGAQGRSEEGATWLRAFAETLPAPVLVTVKAKGVLPDPHPLVLGLLGADTGAAVLAKADLVVTVGVEPEELGEWTPHAAVLHLGPSAPEGALAAATAHALGDVELILEELAPRLRAARRADWDVAELDRLKRRGPSRAPGVPLTPARVAGIAREMTAAGTIAAVDGGAGMWDVAAAWQAVAPREFLAPNRLAAAGVAWPAAIAAQLARADRRVLAFTTEAGFDASRAELETAARLETPIVLLVLAAAPVSLDVPGGLRPATCDDAAALRSALASVLAARRPAVLGVRVRAVTSTV